MQAFTAENSAALGRSGLEPTPGNLYAAHFLGAGDAPKVLGASDNTPVSAILDQRVIAANPHLANMTVGQFKQWAMQKGGGATSPQQTPQASQSQQSRANIARLMQTMSNPWLSPGQQAVMGAMVQAEFKKMLPRDPNYTPLGDEAILDKNSGRVIQVPMTKKTTDIRNLEAENAARAKRGEPPLSPMEFITQVKKSGATQVNIDQKAEGAFNTALGNLTAKDLFERRKLATDAVATLQSNVEAKNLLDSGILAGAFADWRLEFGKALQQAGIKLNDNAIANTEAFAASRAKEVGRIIKLFGAGTGLSDADREFATKAAAGQITLNEESIRRILDINERAARFIVESYNKDASQIDKKLSPFDLTVQIPEFAVPGNRPNRMPTPEEAARELERRRQSR